MVLNSGERLRGQILLVELLAGQLPTEKDKLIIAWIEIHREEQVAD